METSMLCFSRILTSAIAVISLALAGCSGDDLAPDSTPATLSVNTHTVAATEWSPEIHAFGTFESADKTYLSVDSPDLVSSVYFDAGQAVNAGDILIELDGKKQELRLQQATADVSSAKAMLEKAQSTHERYRSLFSRQMISKEQMKQAETDFESAQARLRQASAAEALAQQELKETTVRSPVDGVVESRSVEAGQNVMPGQQLGVIQGINTLRVVTYVTQREVNSLQIGETAPISTQGVPGRQWQGRVELIGSTAEPSTGNFAVRLAVNDPDGLLREGMSARVILKGFTVPDALLIPRSALTDRDRRRVVYTIKDGKAVMVEPVLGLADSERVRVLAGLEAGDQVITSRLDLIVEGTPVQALSTQAPAATQP